MKNNYDYNYEDIKKAYTNLGVSSGKLVFIEADLSCLGRYEKMDIQSLPEVHLNALMELVEDEGTIVVPTASMALCNTDIPFDINNTPSERGIFSEYLRTRVGAVRSLHPFTSCTAIGKNASEICSDVSPQSYGPETPYPRMLERDGLFISIGLHPRLTCSVLHEAEMEMGVPYRYIKEFSQPVLEGTEINIRRFYMHVWYRECEIKKNNKEKLWGDFESGYTVKKTQLGRGFLYSYSMRDFYQCTVNLFKKNMYLLLENEPIKKPYAGNM